MTVMQARAELALPHHAPPPSSRRRPWLIAYKLVLLSSLALTACASTNERLTQPLPELDRKTKPGATPAEQKATIDGLLAKGAQHKTEALKKIEAQK